MTTFVTSTNYGSHKNLFISRSSGVHWHVGAVMPDSDNLEANNRLLERTTPPFNEVANND